MPLGHVAVVTRVISAREIEIDHANWVSPGAISRQVPVLDVSDDNDWTAVRVGLGEPDRFGSLYVTDGFIYGRPIEFGPQIIDVASALRSLRGPELSSELQRAPRQLPMVIEGGAVRSIQTTVSNLEGRPYITNISAGSPAR